MTLLKTKCPLIKWGKLRQLIDKNVTVNLVDAYTSQHITAFTNEHYTVESAEKHRDSFEACPVIYIETGDRGDLFVYIEL